MKSISEKQREVVVNYEKIYGENNIVTTIDCGSGGMSLTIRSERPMETRLLILNRNGMIIFANWLEYLK